MTWSKLPLWKKERGLRPLLFCVWTFSYQFIKVIQHHWPYKEVVGVFFCRVLGDFHFELVPVLFQFHC